MCVLLYWVNDPPCQRHQQCVGRADADALAVRKNFPPTWKMLSAPDPAAPASTALFGAAMFVLILPYLEQQNLYVQIDTTKGALDPANMPPGNPAYSTVVKTYLCPSAPGGLVVDYSTALDLSFANLGCNDVSYPPGLSFGRIDYAPDCGTEFGTGGDGTPGNLGIISLPPWPRRGSRTSPTALRIPC
jgi:hypothetical protein